MSDKDKTPEAPADEYRGATIDKADDEKVDKELVKEDISTLNNNPRNDDL